MKRKKSSAREGAGSRDRIFLQVPRAAVIRLLPVPDDVLVGRPVGEHSIGGNPYICPDITHDKDCPACKAMRALLSSTNKRARKVADELRARTRYWMKVIVRGEEKPKVQILQAPRGIYEPIFGVFSDDGINISDPAEGFDVRINKKGSGLRTRYAAQVLLNDEKPLHENPKVCKRLITAAEEIDLARFLRTDGDLGRRVKALTKGLTKRRSCADGGEGAGGESEAYDCRGELIPGDEECATCDQRKACKKESAGKD